MFEIHAQSPSYALDAPITHVCTERVLAGVRATWELLQMQAALCNKMADSGETEWLRSKTLCHKAVNTSAGQMPFVRGHLVDAQLQYEVAA